ncbi:hypothetical protein [Fodinicola feengrottensis]|uniref:Uncharacterized protein n=1 Tax=Fodinicola feengrottensis TaxID=435914 RepID=A0ABP4RPP2_9ACTN|nr:hypothetical protein [Fodinicola feengrottensis]
MTTTFLRKTRARCAAALAWAQAAVLAWITTLRARDPEAGDTTQTAILTVIGAGTALLIALAIRAWVTGNLKFPSIGGG